MARSTQDTNSQNANTFDKSLQEDVKDFHLESNSWTQARNAVNNSITGDLGDLGNEPANLYCTSTPYKMHGAIHLFADNWLVYSTDNINSEIGLFNETNCSYRTVVNDPCLGFNLSNLITGISRETSDCSWQVYFADGLNPDRVLNIGNPLNWPTGTYTGNNYYNNTILWPGVAWIENCITDPFGCITCTSTNLLNCKKIRFAKLISPLCLSVTKGATGGELLNGSYYVVGAYTIDQQKIGDYFMPSNVQSLFDHDNVAGSIDITVESTDTSYDEFELILVVIVNQQTVARRVGIYSTRISNITIDIIDNRWPAIPVENIPLRYPVVDKSDSIHENGDYLLKVGPTDKLDFNYQPRANQISTQWVAVEYPEKYYYNGGNNTSYLRDEIYTFFIRWVYDTGDKSASYHIPGRYAAPNSTEFDVLNGNIDAVPEDSAGLTAYRWIVENTATAIPASGLAPDGIGQIIARGNMGYWESSESYDDDRPEVWNANIPGHPEWDLCAKKIRHHRFPDNCTDKSSTDQITNHFAPGGEKIRIMGVEFGNIKPPLDLQGNIITNIIGYEILRGTREGNKSVVAKGMINNMYEYNIPNIITSKKGLYPNYPYNPSGNDEFFSSTETFTNILGQIQDYNPIPASNRQKRYFTFHSPDTQFKRPFLSAKEIKIYGEINANFVEGQFIEPAGHPKHKLINNLAFSVAVVSAFGLALVAMNGQRRTKMYGAKTINLGGSIVPPLFPYDGGLLASASNAGTYVAAAGVTATNFDTGLQIAQNIAGVSTDLYYTNLYAALATGGIIPGTMGLGSDYEQEVGAWGEGPIWLRILQGLPSFLHYFVEGVSTIIDFWYAVLPYRQRALQYVSHGFYSTFKCPQVDNNRRLIEDAIYLGEGIQDFGPNYRINNVFRGKSVALQISTNDIEDTLTIDNTRRTIASAPNFSGVTWKNPSNPFRTKAASHYVALKQRLRNQYGQIEAIIQVPVSTCPNPVTLTSTTNPNTIFTSGVLFNGDTYIGRYTEKNTMYFFFDWLYNQPDGFEFNYDTRDMLPYTAYWANFEKFDLSDFAEGISTAFTTLQFSDFAAAFPSGRFVLDRNGVSVGFGIKAAFFYLFSSGVRDFFVESEINISYRDWNDRDAERHYDPYGGYTDYQSTIFNTNIIKAGNFYKYDFSLSISRLYNNFIPWGNTQLRNYNPEVAQDCFVYRPNRVVYSLPQFQESLRDNWLVILPNNYKDFKSRITDIKPINKNGALILFETESPVQFLGLDTLETDTGTKLTIGDGGLFSQPLQNLANADESYEYGSCQDRLSVINTPAGIFYMSQNQGKIFKIGSGLQEISNTQVKWWLATYMDYQLLKDFPNFELTANPVIGLGCQSIYDNANGLIYFCKKDYQLIPNTFNVVTYVGDDNFLVNGMLPIKLGDPQYFEDASWTLSYDPKTGAWLSYHDWHPNYLLPGKNTFMSVSQVSADPTQVNGIWVHNKRCDLYCNYYGFDFPFEIEFTAKTGQTVNSLRSIEYIMEVYQYAANCFDRFHVLDFNFDEAIVYNTEQCSGLLRLNITPKNNAPLIIQYPIINPVYIEILYSKEENKYRFNQFWDITDSRGEFPIGSVYPPPTPNPGTLASRTIFNTSSNGYNKILNNFNLNYSKDPLQHKKFRHYTASILLRRRVSGSNKMLVMIANTKNLYSPR